MSKSEESLEIKLTPTEELIMELLQARYRMGENSWSFDNRHMKALTNLSEKELITFKSAMIEGYQLAWLTDLGYEHLFMNGYSIQIDSKKLQKRQEELHKKAEKVHKRRTRKK